MPHSRLAILRLAGPRNYRMTLDVALCILLHPDKERVLIARRPADVHLGGFWEFPGGKIEDGETIMEAATREAQEEVGLSVSALRPMLPVVHVYSHRTVCLHPVLCQAASDDAKPLASLEVLWIPFRELADIPFPAANQAIVEQLIRELETRD